MRNVRSTAASAWWAATRADRADASQNVTSCHVDLDVAGSGLHEQVEMITQRVHRRQVELTADLQPGDRPGVDDEQPQRFEQVGHLDSRNGADMVTLPVQGCVQP